MLRKVKPYSFGMKYHIGLFFLGIFFFFQRKMARDLEQGALLRKFSTFSKTIHFIGWSEKIQINDVHYEWSAGK